MLDKLFVKLLSSHIPIANWNAEPDSEAEIWHNSTEVIQFKTEEVLAHREYRSPSSCNTGFKLVLIRYENRKMAVRKKISLHIEQEILSSSHPRTIKKFRQIVLSNEDRIVLK